ncbi:MULTISPECIES: hypothetical protein [unclassified Streptomyces]|uniref:hypothetical protein n=1 Tax=unclassified Streptomyces TaxID=2593676 RepID=UPI001650D4B7|nr:MULTISPECIES: hypothetical protein [unclassified Streptomyces]
MTLDRLQEARRIGAEAAVRAAVALLHAWSPVLREIVSAVDPRTVGTFRYHACDPGRI